MLFVALYVVHLNAKFYLFFCYLKVKLFAICSIKISCLVEKTRRLWFDLNKIMENLNKFSIIVKILLLLTILGEYFIKIYYFLVKSIVFIMNHSKKRDFYEGVQNYRKKFQFKKKQILQNFKFF